MNFARFRKAKGLSQADVAHRMAASQATVSKIEGGFDGTTLGMLSRYADAIEVPLSVLFGDDRDPIEELLVRAFRQLSPDRRQGWIDIAQALADPTGSGTRTIQADDQKEQV